MKICFVTEGSLEDFWENGLRDVGAPDLLVFGFHGLKSLSYKKELDGETEYFHDVAILSRELSCTVVCGCYTETYDTRRASAVIADKGRILGVSDMAHALHGGELACGGGFRVYDASACKIGLLIGEDLFFPEAGRVLTLCDAELVLSVFPPLESALPQVVMRATAFCNGVTVAMCSTGACQIADIKGEIALESRAKIVRADVNLQKDYHLISCRRRGIYREIHTGF
jgi:predicted amidohydrolase